VEITKTTGNYQWTKSGGRLLQVISNPGRNWLFVPAPGLGSESLTELITLLQEKVQGSLWLLEHPNDGSNIAKTLNFANWRKALIEAAIMLEKPILVGHSTGAKLIQNTSEIEALASGFVFMSTAPDMRWKSKFLQHMQQNTTQAIRDSASEYIANPGNETLRSLLIASLKFCFMPKSLSAGIKMMENLPINHIAASWSDLHFDPIYKAKFVPKAIPTLILAGEYDQITPINVYADKTEYHRKNILIKKISNAAHYPWFDNPGEIRQFFLKFIELYQL
jgi:pimeloyl-ACP methyl ester carboxylesterase